MKNGGAAMMYVLITISTCILAAILKVFVAPAHVDSAKAAAGLELWKSESGAQKHLYFAVSDCAVRAHNINATVSSGPLMKPDGTVVSRDDIIVECVGNYFVFRASFALMLFYVFMAVATAAFQTAHNGCWACKFGLYTIGFVVTFFIENPMFYGFAGLLVQFRSCTAPNLHLGRLCVQWWENFMKRMKAQRTPQCHSVLPRDDKGFKCLFLTACLGFSLADL